MLRPLTRWILFAFPVVALSPLSLWSQSQVNTIGTDPVDLPEIEIHLIDHDRDSIPSLLKQRGLSDSFPKQYSGVLLSDFGAGGGALAAIDSARIVTTPENTNAADRHLNEELQIRSRLLKDPENGRLHQVLGSIFLREKKMADGISESREAVKRLPDSASAHFQLGSALLEQKKTQEGIAEVREAARLRPDESSQYTLFRFLAQFADRPSSAAHAGASSPPDVSSVGRKTALSAAAVPAEPQQKTTPQTKAAPQAAPLTPEAKQAQLHYRIALEALKNNDLNTATAELKSASELAPNNALIWYNLAVVESNNGDANSALEHLHKALNFGLPAKQKEEADGMEAKLIYEGRKQALSKTLQTLQMRFSQSSSDENCSPLSERDRSFGFSYGLQEINDSKLTISYRMESGASSGMGSRNYVSNSRKDEGHYRFNLHDLSTVTLSQSANLCAGYPGAKVYVPYIVEVSTASGEPLISNDYHSSYERKFSVGEPEVNNFVHQDSLTNMRFSIEDQNVASDIARLLKEAITEAGGK